MELAAEINVSQLFYNAGRNLLFFSFKEEEEGVIVVVTRTASSENEVASSLAVCIIRLDGQLYAHQVQLGQELGDWQAVSANHVQSRIES